MNKFRTSALLLFLLSATWMTAGFAADKTLQVFAADDLKNAFVEAGASFEVDHFKIKVVFNFSKSGQLAGKIESGAAADVFAFDGGTATLDRLSKKNMVGDSAIIARNKLIVVASKQAKTKIENLADLSKKGLRLLMPAAKTPAGEAAQQFLKNADRTPSLGADYSARVLGNVSSEGADGKALIAKLAGGEGDAGIVFLSDVNDEVKNKIMTIPIPDQLNVFLEYRLAIMKKSTQAEAAKDFYDLLLSPEGASLFKKYGLLPAAAK